ncbi:MAG: 6,7-dimethyl-8-ribityllumazine synthase [Cytophagaceae bacterium]|nr:6,7-dimethyl-8-ribityllumazine synthase [Cytophagaceae bacterium]MBK9508849.1 6,7-dimethyl-8-ribityllumazine synthase [Cytophagaceae bacterium]MBK9935755.1 6,7-dimethyl-8-ribityllumazine synthase [Cytophagaceae bacterium]MBL0302188.1 6,7-dimethyl-8-ribityllumazine synthase [Cytophagaceae bacterium]MBL0325014.1 6,7-dimethyl-8-ribityllumazine synthase [Cytophagaceae bacterium]
MASVHKNLSIFKDDNLPDISWKKFVVLVAEWNDDITEPLAQGAVDTLLKYGAKETHIKKVYVPGTYELSFGAQVFAQKEDVDAVIAIGCVIQGETKHNDYINHAVANGLTEVSLKYNKPVVFGVLTPNTHQQAVDRAGGKHGNKGDEAAITAIKMLGIS